MQICILTKNNQSTIKKTLESVSGFGDICVSDYGSTDETIDICKKYGKVESVPFKDFSTLKNSMIRKDPVFFIEPWEILLSKSIPEIESAYHIQILENNIITKDIRLWHPSTKLKWTNPVYETVLGKSEYSDLLVYSQGRPKVDNKLLREWKEQEPTNTGPYYYDAFESLLSKNYKEFLIKVEYYIGLETGIASVMAQYYKSMVLLYIYNNINDSYKTIIRCLAEKPVMAEFWCLLGDIFYKTKDFNKAIQLYENAILLGQKRWKTDMWPIELEKYEEYPKKMIDFCKNTSINEFKRV